MGVLIRGLVVAAVMLLGGAAAHAQGAFPSRTVRLIAPYPPGGAVDLLTRTVGDELSRLWGQTVIIENRPGAGGVIASQNLVGSLPDGYSLMVVSSGHATTPYLSAKLPYDLFKDFTPIAMLAASINMFVVRADSAYKTLADLIAAARAKPGTITFGNSGIGTSAHLAGELLKHLAKIDIVPVHYRGGAASMNDLLSGQIPLSVNNAPEALSHIQAGSARALGVTSATRSTFLPDVPTIAEAGVPGYETVLWFGLLGPAGMPADIVAKINRDCLTILALPAVQQRLALIGATAYPSSPQDFDRTIRAENATWGPIIVSAGIKPQ